MEASSTSTSYTSIGRQVLSGVSLRSTGLSGYHDRMAPVSMSNRDLVPGHSMQPSWVNIASRNPSE